VAAQITNSAGGAERVNILLVDDQPARLLSYELILEGLGQNLVRAHSGLEALEKLMSDDYAVVLLDVSMPGMDGFETASLIHDHPRYEKTPIIFVTGVHVTELDRLKGYKLGAVDYVYIPVVPEILRSKVEVLVELYSKRRELQTLNRSLENANAQLAEANTLLEAEKTRELEQLNHTLQQINRDLALSNEALQAEVAERARIERALKEADRHKDEFLAMLAHELRNPLAPIFNAVQIMRRKPMNDPQLAWSRDVIQRQLGHLTRLVDDLLDVSRITRGKINVTREPIELSLIVARAIETVQPMLTEKRHELTVNIAQRSLQINGDLTRLTQVIGNVLGNAAKYTDAAGRIELSADCDGSHVEIRVRDNGIGIPQELLPSVFGLFTQLERTSDRTQGGLGIGLALVRKLVEMHEGTVVARSDGIGKGSEFIIRLPRMIEKPMEDEFDPDAHGAAAPAEKSGRRILVADDNVDALESLATLLEINGHEVHTASDGMLAVEVAAKCRPEVALLDIGMPRMDGYEVARRIRAEAWGKNTVLVALTGWGQDEDRRRTREAGFDSHLVKPLDLEVLSEFLAHLPLDQKTSSVA
jgi:signal transduction histidine kinase